ncbi:hypothetical protein ACFL1X_10610 [Candidatus Hydrogenedentota bacterium]
MERYNECGSILGKIIDFEPDASPRVFVSSPEYPGISYMPDVPGLLSALDAEGNFKFCGLRAGQYTVHAVQDDDVPLEIEQTVTVKPGEDAHVDLEFQKVF